MRARARSCPDLRLRVEDGCAPRYPAWVSGNVAADLIAVHTLDDSGWQACLHAVTWWPTASLTVGQMAWQLDIFSPVLPVPPTEPGGPPRTGNGLLVSAEGRRPKMRTVGRMRGGDGPSPSDLTRAAWTGDT